MLQSDRPRSERNELIIASLLDGRRGWSSPFVRSNQQQKKNGIVSCLSFPQLSYRFSQKSFAPPSSLNILEKDVLLLSHFSSEWSYFLHVVVSQDFSVETAALDTCVSGKSVTIFLRRLSPPEPERGIRLDMWKIGITSSNPLHTQQDLATGARFAESKWKCSRMGSKTETLWLWLLLSTPAAFATARLPTHHAPLTTLSRQ